MMEWINVNMLQPQADFEVLVVLDDDVFIATFREWDVGFYFETTNLNYENITHWMSLPEPPNENNDG